MYKLEVKLKQHTPLIHFQWNEEGATLRASEVKPKLDRFILTNLGKGCKEDWYEKGVGEYNKVKKYSKDESLDSFKKLENYEKGYWIAKANKWLIGNGEHPALDYKMRIVSKGRHEFLIMAGSAGEVSSSTVEILSDTCYFAQKKSNKEIIENGSFHYEKWNDINKKRGLLWDSVDLIITTFHLELGEYIEEGIGHFFICVNFGTRATKGFGSFTVISKNGNLYTCEYEDILKNNFDFVCKKNPVVEKDRIYKTIKEDWQKIKSGRNYPYEKSILFCYAIAKMEGSPRWEKRKMKQIIQSNKKGFTLHVKNNNSAIENIEGEQSWKDPQPGYQYNFIRALLGLPKQYEFLLDGGDGKKNSKAIVKVDGDKDIQRFPSPLYFKVIEGNIYLVANEINKYILNKKFQFHYNYKLDGKTFNLEVEEPKENDVKSFAYSCTPSEFSLISFIKYAINNKESYKLDLGYEELKKLSKP